MKPQPPCGRHCPKRCAVPNCHDPAICGDWAAYQDALTSFNRNVLAGRRSARDYAMCGAIMYASAKMNKNERRESSHDAG